MKAKYIIMVSLILAILTIGAVSASDDFISDDGNLTASPEDTIVESSVDDVDLIADDDVGEDDNELISDYDYSVDVADGYLVDRNIYAHGKLPRDASGTVSAQVDGENTDESELEDNYFYLDLGYFGQKGSHNCVITYSGDAKYAGFTYQKTFTVGDVAVNFPDEVIDRYNDEDWIRVNEAATGQLTINFDGNEYKSGSVLDLKREYDDGIYYIPVILDSLSFGTHTYEVIYIDDEGTIRLDGSFNKTYRLSIDEDLDSVPYGADFDITVNAPDDARSNLTVNLNGNSFEYKLNSDETTITLTNLVFGQNTLTLTYSDDKYPLKTVKYVMNVKGVFSTPGGTFDYTTDEVISLTLPSGVSGMVVIYEDTGETYEKYVGYVLVKNGYAEYPIKNLGLGTHRLVLKYENGTYDVDDGEAYIDIYPVITYDKGVTVGQDAKFTVGLPENSNGNLIISIVEYDEYGDPVDWEADPIELYNSQVNTNEITVNLNTSKAGFYKISFSYEEGDISVNNNYNEFVFNVYSGDNNWQLDVDFPEVLFQGDYVYVPINYPEGANGDLNFYVDGNRVLTIGGVGREDSDLDFAVNFGLGTHTWEIKYSGDTFYTDSYQNGTFEVTWIDVPVVLEVGGNTNIEVNVIGGSGSVKLMIDGEDYAEKDLIDNHATFDMSGLSQGNHTYEITYGDLSKSGSFEMSYKISVYAVGSEDEDDHIEFSKSNEIEVYIPGATGNFNVEFRGMTFSGHLDEGVGVIQIPLAWGENELKITFEGDENHNYKEIKKTLTVDHGKVIVNYEDGIFTNAYLYLPEDAEGSLIIYEYDKTVALKDGEATIDAEGLPAGCYGIDISYDGNDYKVYSEYVYVSIQPDMNITSEITELDDCIIDIELPGSSSDIDIYVDGEKNMSAQFEDGKLHAVISGLSQGNHTITFEYYDWDYKNPFEYYDEDEYEYYPVQYNVNVKPAESISPDFKIFIEDVEYGNPIEVNVTANKAFEGDVTVKIGGNDVLVHVANGEGKTVTGLSLPVGNYTATIDFEGNAKFTAYSAQTDFNVNEITVEGANIEIIANNVDLGNNATITINLNDKATGMIFINVTKKHDGFVLDGTTYNKTLAEPVIKGKVTFTLDDLSETGLYEITAIYSGDGNVESETKTSTFKVLRDANIEIIAVDEIEENETLTVTIKRNCVDGDMPSMSISVKSFNSLGSNSQFVIGNDAVSNVTFNNLVAGDATIEVSFSGSNHFKEATVSKAIKITPHLLDPNLKIEIPDEINEGETAVVSFTINETAYGTVTIIVDGVNKTVTKYKYDSFGSEKYTFEFENLSPGMKNVTVIYSGNYDPKDLSSGNGTQIKYFAKANKTGSFYVKPIPVSPGLDASANEIYEGQNATITVTINNTVTGKVTIKVDGEDKVIDISEGMGTFTISELPAGEHNFTISFEGDEYFLAENKTVTVNVKENRFEIIPVTTEVDYQDGSFTFKLIDPDTGNALANKTVKVSGKNSAGTNLFWSFANGDNSYRLSRDIILTSDENGIVTLDATFYPGVMLENVFSPVGTYNMTINGSGYLKGSIDIILKVNKIDINVTVEKFDEYYGTDKKFTIIVTNAKTGKPVQYAAVDFNVTINGEKINYTNSNLENISSLTTNSEGKVELPASSLGAGEYVISANVNETINFNGNSSTGLAIIKKIPVVVNAENMTMNYGDNSPFVINITKDGESLSGVYAYVKLYNGTENYTAYLLQSNAEGVISFPAILDAGIYNVVIASGDSRYGFDQINKSITVNQVNSSVDISDAVFDYAQEYVIPYSLVGASDIDVKLNVTGYSVSKGKNTLTIRNLMPGSYLLSIETIADKNHYSITKNVSLTVNKLNPSLSIKEIGNIEQGKMITVEISAVDSFSGDVKVQVGDVNATATLVNGKGNVTVSSESLAVGAVSVKVSSDENDTFLAGTAGTIFNVTAKQDSGSGDKKPVATKITLTLKKVKVKKSAKKLVLSATLKINGKYAKKGTKVVFKFKGKKYTAKVKAKGVAKVTIKKKVLKKLKVGKKVKYQVSYGKKTVKKTVKVKK